MNFKTLLKALTLVASSCAVVMAGPVTLADTTADYSGTQGGNGWSYGYFQFPGTAFTTTGYTFGDSFGGWWALGTTGASNYEFQGPSSKMHPGYDASTSTQYDTVREYTDSTYTGAVDISGLIQKVDAADPAQTITATIYLNGTSIYSYVLAGDNQVGQTFDVGATLNMGDKLDFAVSTGVATSTIGNDLTIFQSTITETTATPEPATFLGAGALLVSLSLIRRRRTAR